MSAVFITGIGKYLLENDVFSYICNLTLVWVYGCGEIDEYSTLLLLTLFYFISFYCNSTDPTGVKPSDIEHVIHI
jgi:hypothetical protein